MLEEALVQAHFTRQWTRHPVNEGLRLLRLCYLLRRDEQLYRAALVILDDFVDTNNQSNVSQAN